MPIYLLQVLAPPKTFLLLVEHLLNGFLWDKKAGDKRIHWKAWQGLCFPVEEAGLGFRDFATMIEAFGSKLWICLHSGGSLWADFMHQKYFPLVHLILADGSKGSSTWRRICRAWENAE